MRTILPQKLQVAFAFVLLTITFGCQKSMNNGNGASSQKPGGGTDFTPKELKNFVQLNLVGNTDTERPANIDGNLINAWDISFSPSGIARVSSEGKGVSAGYNLDGISIASAIGIPFPAISSAGHPTGQVFNLSPDFKLPNGNPAEFIFATSDGTISGWNSGPLAVKKVDRSPAACYLGVAVANVGGDFFLYAANFSQNRIDVFDKNWNLVNDKPFVDPDLPAGYSPFNIQVIGDGKVYVMYAKKDGAGKKETGPGNGYINIFSPGGSLIKRFASKGKLDAPWGIVKAPAGFWGEGSQLANMILVGNNGDGHINVFSEEGDYLGVLSTNGKAIEIDGLWGITFPPINGFNRYSLYFAAGPNNGSGGLVGRLKNKFLN